MAALGHNPPVAIHIALAGQAVAMLHQHGAPHAIRGVSSYCGFSALACWLQPALMAV